MEQPSANEGKGKTPSPIRRRVVVGIIVAVLAALGLMGLRLNQLKKAQKTSIEGAWSRQIEGKETGEESWSFQVQTDSGGSYSYDRNTMDAFFKHRMWEVGSWYLQGPDGLWGESAARIRLHLSTQNRNYEKNFRRVDDNRLMELSDDGSDGRVYVRVSSN
jgi:hypothetical protein